MKSQVLIDIVEAYMNRDGAADFFTVLIEILMANGMTLDDLPDCFGIEDDLDLAIESILEEYEDKKEEDEDEWPDGGREMF